MKNLPERLEFFFAETSLPKRPVLFLSKSDHVLKTKKFVRTLMNAKKHFHVLGGYVQTWSVSTENSRNLQ